MQVAGKVALITGGSQGLGEAVALALGRAGAGGVALVARNEARLAVVAEAVRATGTPCFPFPADVRSQDQVNRAFAAAEAALGPIDLVINNAGVGAHKQFSTLTSEEADDIINVNVNGVMHVMRASIETMESRGGMILNVASALGKLPLFGYSVYTASKAAVVFLSRVARKELAPSGITLLCFCPGVIDTPFQDERREELKRMPRFIVQTPDRVAANLLRIIRREKNEAFGQAYLGFVHFFYRLLRG